MKKKIYYNRIYLSVLLVGLSFGVSVSSVFAYSVENLKVDARNDFVLEPGKVELFLEPGETVVRTVSITNRVSKKVKFKIETEDFVGSRDAQNPVLLLGDKRSPYSFKDALIPEVREFTLDFGQRITIPIKVQIPQDAQPGGFYSSVIISNQPDRASGLEASGPRVISRLGALFFIRVKGEVKEAGQLEDVRIAGPDKLFYQKGPFIFQILFNNTGTVHLVPYGKINITNFAGSLLATLPVDGYFALPDSLRYREVSWYSDFLFGRYKATVELNRGYKNGSDVTDVQSIAFWVLPWKFILATFGIIFILVGIFFYVRKNFEFKRK